MAYNTKEVLKDKEGNPIGQYFNQSDDKYEAVEGTSGANKTVLYNEDGTVNDGLNWTPVLNKLDQLTGTVIDEETRNANEIVRQENEEDRIELYDDIANKLATGQLKGDKGDKGDQGEQGIQGIQGPKGEQGIQGPKGETGEGLNILGSFDDESELPATGNVGDAYLIEGDLYVWDGEGFLNVGNIIDLSEVEDRIGYLEGVRVAVGTTQPTDTILWLDTGE